MLGRWFPVGYTNVTDRQWLDIQAVVSGPNWLPNFRIRNNIGDVEWSNVLTKTTIERVRASQSDEQNLDRILTWIEDIIEPGVPHGESRT